MQPCQGTHRARKAGHGHTCFGDVIHKERPHRAAVVCAGDGTVAFLTRSVPDLGLDGFPVHL